MEMPLVTVIVPAYNCEKTVERCLVSIKNQTYRNLEILVVNDGSTDHTMRILEKYAKADDRIRILDKKNTGVSDSRNCAIKEAKGEYLQFVDSDDWLIPTATEQFVRLAQTHGCEMVITDYYRVNGKKIYIRGHIDREGLLSRKEFAEYMMKAPANFYYGVLWNKFFKTQILREHNLLCSEQLDWCEDFLLNLEYLQYVKTIYVSRTPVYYYVKTKGSLVDTQVTFSQTMRTKKILFEYYKDLYQSMDLYEENKWKIQMFFVAVAKDKSKRKKSA